MFMDPHMHISILLFYIHLLIVVSRIYNSLHTIRVICLDFLFMFEDIRLEKEVCYFTCAT